MRPPPRSPGELPIGFAHRGASAECRDNTMPSFRRALELGARGVESDAWTTADGVVVLDHDGTVRRGLRRLPIGTLPRRALPAHIPELADLLAVCGPEVDISLDVRDRAAVGPTLDAIEAAGRAARTWLCGRPAELVAWRSRSPRVRLVDSTRLRDIAEGLPARLSRLADGGVDAVNLRWPEWDRARVELVQRAGLLAFAWDAQRAETLAALVGMGVDAVYSDHVTRMVDALARAGNGRDG